MSHYALLPLLAFTSMFIQDVFAVWLVRAEAAGRAHAAARWDVLGDAARLTGLAANTDAILLSHNLLLSVLTVLATFTADYWGTVAGVKLGVHLDHRRETRAAVSAVLSAVRQLDFPQVCKHLPAPFEPAGCSSRPGDGRAALAVRCTA